MFITPMEILDIIVITFAIGFIFSGIFVRKPSVDDYVKGRIKLFSWKNIMFAAAIAAPAVILHELGHKFTALAFGVQSTFHAAYLWLLIGMFLRLINFGFIFFIPAYVSWSGVVQPWQSSLIAFAGPAVNLILWLSTLAILKTRKLNIKKRYFLTLTSRINMFLFIFNMLPIPPFDGFYFFQGIIRLLGF